MGAVNFITTIVAMRAPGMTMYVCVYVGNSDYFNLDYYDLSASGIRCLLWVWIADSEDIFWSGKWGERYSGSTCSGSSGTLRCMCLRYLSSA